MYRYEPGERPVCLPSVLKLVSCTPLSLHAMICQQQVSQRPFTQLQDDRAALRHPIFEVIQLCCITFLMSSAAADCSWYDVGNPEA